MKKPALTILLFILGSLNYFAKGQVFAHPGATWIFHAGYVPWTCYATDERWEYVGDTVFFGMAAKDVKITSKTSYTYPPSTYSTSQFHHYFHVSGDTVSIFNDNDSTWQELYNFSLQIGDTTQSPLANCLNVWANCPDSIPYQCPAIVADTGHATIGGQSLRYYTLKFRPGPDTTMNFQTYYERIITTGYWYPTDNYWCGILVECSGLGFVCYKDDGMFTDSLCIDQTWFETLALEDEKGSLVKISPNPVQNILFIEAFEPFTEKLSVFSIDGRIIQIFQPNNSIDLSHLSPGLYFLTNESRTWCRKFVKD